MTGKEFQVGRFLAMLCTFVKFRKKKKSHHSFKKYEHSSELSTMGI